MTAQKIKFTANDADANRLQRELDKGEELNGLLYRPFVFQPQGEKEPDESTLYVVDNHSRGFSLDLEGSWTRLHVTAYLPATAQEEKAKKKAGKPLAECGKLIGTCFINAFEFVQNHVPLGSTEGEIKKYRQSYAAYFAEERKVCERSEARRQQDFEKDTAPARVQIGDLAELARITKAQSDRDARTQQLQAKAA